MFRKETSRTLPTFPLAWIHSRPLAAVPLIAWVGSSSCQNGTLYALNTIVNSFVQSHRSPDPGTTTLSTQNRRPGSQLTVSQPFFMAQAFTASNTARRSAISRFSMSIA